jgi:hypothetical protein
MRLEFDVGGRLRRWESEVHFHNEESSQSRHVNSHWRRAKGRSPAFPVTVQHSVSGVTFEEFNSDKNYDVSIAGSYSNDCRIDNSILLHGELYCTVYEIEVAANSE